MGTRLFVGRLPHSKNGHDLGAMFSPSGTVKAVRIATDKETGLSRGFGFVRMGTDAEAERAIARLHSTELDGKKLIVRAAKAQGDKNEAAPQAGGGSKPRKS